MNYVWRSTLLESYLELFSVKIGLTVSHHYGIKLGGIRSWKPGIYIYIYHSYESGIRKPDNGLDLYIIEYGFNILIRVIVIAHFLKYTVLSLEKVVQTSFWGFYFVRSIWKVRRGKIAINIGFQTIQMLY